ncbi:MAG: GNAT family N-acetyltransferase [Geminicoccaceae bacterium]
MTLNIATNDPLPASAEREAGQGRHIRIRRAEGSADIEVIVDLVRQAIAESLFSRFDFAEDRVRRQVAQRISQEAVLSCELIAERDGAPIGVLTGMLSEYTFVDARGASVTLLYVAPEGRGSLAAVKLLRGFRRWAAHHRASALSVHVTTNHKKDRTHLFLQRMGFRVTGGNYLLPL